MTTPKPLQIMIHDLNPWGGQDRSMLEIAWRVNKTLPLEIHSYSLEGYDQWPQMKHIRYKSLIQRPVLFKYLNYHLKSAKNISTDTVTQSTGTASLKSDIVQVQFIHHSWKQKNKNLVTDKSPSLNILKNFYHHWLTKYKLALEKRLYTPAKKYIAISHGIKKELIEHFNIPFENIEIIYHGVDTHTFCPAAESPELLKNRENLRKSLGIEESDVVLLHVGALNARKGLYKSLEVIKYLKENDFQSVKLLAVGQGDSKILQRTVDKYDIADRVQFVSHSKKVQEYYQAADIFFFPTVYEPFGLVILEAMSCGLPTLTSTVAGASELLEGQHKNYLFPENTSAQEIADLLAPLIKSPELRVELSKEARELALAHSWDHVGDQYTDFYNRYFQQRINNDTTN